MEYQIMVDGIEIQSNEQVNEKEARAYISYIRKNNPKKEISSVELSFDGEEVGLGYHLQPEGFEKIRRITGYLVGTVDALIMESAQRSMIALSTHRQQSAAFFLYDILHIIEISRSGKV